ncbi:hypothetical protein FACS1894202_03810 [Clostridia bacterium]|nr:hypothetical protein FACS1894202_03810 [Clostridia bacterium]
MNTSYTRQRQGRDFPVHTDESVKAEGQKRDFLRTIERHKKEADRNRNRMKCPAREARFSRSEKFRADPVDGREPDGISPSMPR